MGEKGVEPSGLAGTVGKGSAGSVGGLSASSLGIADSSVTKGMKQGGTVGSSGGSPPPPPPEGPSTGETVVDVVETVLDPVGSLIKKIF